MSLLATFFSTFILAAKRLLNQRLLMLCLLAGLVAAVGLLSSIPLYADAVHHELLQGELTEAGAYRPPFAFLWRYVGAWHGDVGWAAYATVDEYLSQQVAYVISLPLESRVRHVKTGNQRLFPAGGSGAFAEHEPLLWTSLGFVSSLEEHIELVEGAFTPPESPPQEGKGVPVLVSQVLAEQLGLQVGERYVLFDTGGAGVVVIQPKNG
jgi:putative ABC transport system permease protein